MYGQPVLAVDTGHYTDHTLLYEHSAAPCQQTRNASSKNSLFLTGTSSSPANLEITKTAAENSGLPVKNNWWRTVWREIKTSTPGQPVWLSNWSLEGNQEQLPTKPNLKGLCLNTPQEVTFQTGKCGSKYERHIPFWRNMIISCFNQLFLLWEIPN